MTPRTISSDCLHRALALLVCASCVGLAGCRNSAVRHTDRLEAKLRDQESSISQLTASLDKAKTDRDSARRELSILRKELSQRANSSPVVQTAHALSRIDRVEIVPLLSGGLDRDDTPGDELISLLIAPKDAEGEIHRVSGTLSVQLKDLSRPADRQVIGTADLDLPEADALWHNGLVGRGFRVIIPIAKTTLSSDVTAFVQFTDTTGRQFAAIDSLRISPSNEQSPPADRDQPARLPIEASSGGIPITR